MRRVRMSVVAGALLALAFVTVLVFQAFDRGSHSASDTLRPFLLTMLPLWIAATAGAAALLRRRPR